MQGQSLAEIIFLCIGVVFTGWCVFFSASYFRMAIRRQNRIERFFHLQERTGLSIYQRISFRVTGLILFVAFLFGLASLLGQ
jgi:ABC-type multidrug transport system permease subunit